MYFFKDIIFKLETSKIPIGYSKLFHDSKHFLKSLLLIIGEVLIKKKNGIRKLILHFIVT